MSTPPGGGPQDEGREEGRPGGEQAEPGGEQRQPSDWGTPPPPGEPRGPTDQAWGPPAQQPPGQPQWGAPPAGGYAGAPQTSGLAVGALVSSILGFFCGIGFIIGLILGYNARNQIRASAGYQTGEGIATAAIVIGWIGVGLTVLAIVLFVLFFAAFGVTQPGMFG